MPKLKRCTVTSLYSVQDQAEPSSEQVQFDRLPSAKKIYFGSGVLTKSRERVVEEHQKPPRQKAQLVGSGAAKQLSCLLDNRDSANRKSPIVKTKCLPSVFNNALQQKFQSELTNLTALPATPNSNRYRTAKKTDGYLEYISEKMVVAIGCGRYTSEFHRKLTNSIRASRIRLPCNACFLACASSIIGRALLR